MRQHSIFGILRNFWPRTAVISFLLAGGIFFVGAQITSYGEPMALSPIGPTIVQNDFLLRSGVAYDASEDALGLIHVQAPKSFFKPTTNQVTWWGEFKPFKTWGKPKLTAKWYDPEEKLVATQNFKGNVCRLAKSNLKTAEMNLENNMGRWRVDIQMKGEKIDSKNFYISDASQTGAPQVTVQALPVR